MRLTRLALMMAAGALLTGIAFAADAPATPAAGAPAAPAAVLRGSTVI